MVRHSNTSEYSKLSIQDLLGIVSTDFHIGMKETFATVNQQLEIAHKLEPHDEELEFAWASLRGMEKDFNQHIQKEEQLLFPLFSLKNRKQNPSSDDTDIRDFVSQLKSEHNALRKQVSQIKKVTNNYQCESSSTPSHKLAYAQLNDLEQDFTRLFFVEEEYVFPRVLRIHNK